MEVLSGLADAVAILHQKSGKPLFLKELGRFIGGVKTVVKERHFERSRC
jgi:hypothetical protein